MPESRKQQKDPDGYWVALAALGLYGGGMMTVISFLLRSLDSPPLISGENWGIVLMLSISAFMIGLMMLMSDPP